MARPARGGKRSKPRVATPARRVSRVEVAPATLWRDLFEQEPFNTSHVAEGGLDATGPVQGGGFTRASSFRGRLA